MEGVSVPTAPSPVVVWLHGDSLSPTDAALSAHPDAPALFVYDRPFLSTHAIAFTRLAFMYGGVRDVAAARPGLTELRVGSVSAELAAFVAEHEACELHVTENPTPEFGSILSGVRERCPALRVVIYPAERLSTYSGQVNKFFGFWKKVESEVLGGGELFRDQAAPQTQPGQTQPGQTQPGQTQSRSGRPPRDHRSDRGRR